MAVNAWLSVIAKKGAVVVYPRTIRCQQWNDTFGMVFFLFFPDLPTLTFPLKIRATIFQIGMALPRM